MHAVGLEEYQDEDFISGKTDRPEIYSENTYRHERGVALRPWYKDPSETLPAPEREKLGEDDREVSLVDVPKPRGPFHFKKTKEKRNGEIDQAKLENDRRREHNARVKRLQHEHDVEENRGALVENTKTTNRGAQKRARLDELVKSSDKALEHGEDRVEKLERRGEREERAPERTRKPETSRKIGKGVAPSRRDDLEPPVPKDIGGKAVVHVDGRGMNCLINALLTAVGQHSGRRVIEAREFLVMHDVAERNEMLELASAAGAQLIAYLRSKHLLGGDRGVRVHYFMGGKLAHQDVAGGGNPVQIFLSFRERHFYAVMD
jgi:hypothetical protein